MEYPFSYEMSIGGHDVDGVAVLVEAGTDADGYIPFLVETIQFDRHTPASRPSFAFFKLDAALREWVRDQIHADEAAQAAWDEEVGNEASDYSAPYSTMNHAAQGAGPMSKHTPGPWKVFNGIDVFPDDDDLDGNRQIADCDTALTDHVSTLEKRANARLIAAAPELLAALKELLELTDDPANDADPEESVFTFARSVIAKAEGGAA